MDNNTRVGQTGDMPSKIANLVGWTLVALALVLLAVPVWLRGEGLGSCDAPGVLGALQTEGRFGGLCDVAAYVRIYHVAPFLVIGIGCLISARTIFKQDDE